MTALTRDDVIAVFGGLDDCAVTEIIGTGASHEELTEAAAWIANDEALLRTGRPRAGGRVGQLVDILATTQENEESLLESGVR